ncbi:MAG: type I DNA topoisomerase [Candidatus Delongbacteria bacterium]|nr:type I DNA topoisomerase [Candidatus Delongbacteria bacterium]
MKQKLVIVESPTKVRTIKKFLGKEFQVLATMGHIVDLPEDKLGIEVENDFKPQYTIVKGKQKIIQQIRDQAAKSDEVYLGPDPDREGEAIAWHVAGKIPHSHYFRIRFNEITPQAIKQAIEDRDQIDLNLVNSQQARRLLDRLVGYKISPFLWKTVYKGLSAGRVQSVALRMICEREDEIRRFIQKEYWTIDVMFDHPQSSFKASLDKYRKKKLEIEDQAQADHHVTELRKQSFSVDGISAKTQMRQPAFPFITSTLQQEASRRLGMTPKKTMMIAQQLYEGIPLHGDDQIGLITYMRTDSIRINQEYAGRTRGYIKQTYGESYVGKGVFARSKKKTDTKIQDAHEAIRPTYLEHSPASIRSRLTPDQFKLYSLIWNRYIASQMASAVYDITRIDITAGEYELRAVGSVLKFEGFLKVYQDMKQDKQGEDQAPPLPVLKEKEILKPGEFLPEQHFTKPAPRYNDASLIRELEQKGIGRPSTYAQIISTLLDRKYVVLEEKRMKPTEVGEIVNRIVVENFPKVADIGFTSVMEDKLDKIERGDADWIHVLKDFYGPFAEILAGLEQKRHQIKETLQEKTGQKCPLCQSDLIMKWGKHGQFLACSNYPKCKYTQPHPKEIEAQKTEDVCPQCGQANLIIKTGKFGRFLACSRYPECKYTGPLSLKIKCPAEGCTGELVERQSKKGKVFYSCSRYPECDYATWDLPINRACPQCGYHFLLQKQTKRSKGGIYCKQCGYKEKKE